jgi:hypothetical protein
MENQKSGPLNRIFCKLSQHLVQQENFVSKINRHDMIEQMEGIWIQGSRNQRDKTSVCTLQIMAGNLTLVIEENLGRLRFSDAQRIYTSAKLGPHIGSHLDSSIEQNSQNLPKFDPTQFDN